MNIVMTVYSKQYVYLTFGEYLEDECRGNGSFLSITEQTPLTDTHIHHHLTAKPQLFSYTITVKKQILPKMFQKQSIIHLQTIRILQKQSLQVCLQYIPQTSLNEALSWIVLSCEVT